MEFEIDKARFEIQLRRDEGSSRWAYRDSLGFNTVGIGRLCDKRFPVSGLSNEEQTYLLGNDIERILKEALAELPWINSLDSVRRAALLNMCFQMGADKVSQFNNSLHYLRDKNYDLMARHLKQSLWFSQTPERATRVIKQLVTGEWQ